MANFNWGTSGSLQQADPMALLQAGQQGISSSLSGLNRLVNDKLERDAAEVARAREAEKVAKADRLTAFKTSLLGQSPEAIQAGLKDGSAYQALDAMGSDIDQLAARTALNDALVSSRQLARTNSAFDEEQRLNAAKPVLAEANTLYSQGKLDEAESLLKSLSPSLPGVGTAFATINQARSSAPANQLAQMRSRQEALDLEDKLGQRALNDTAAKLFEGFKVPTTDASGRKLEAGERVDASLAQVEGSLTAAQWAKVQPYVRELAMKKYAPETTFNVGAEKSAKERNLEVIAQRKADLDNATAVKEAAEAQAGLEGGFSDSPRGQAVIQKALVDVGLPPTATGDPADKRAGVLNVLMKYPTVPASVVATILRQTPQDNDYINFDSDVGKNVEKALKAYLATPKAKADSDLLRSGGSEISTNRQALYDAQLRASGKVPAKQ